MKKFVLLLVLLVPALSRGQSYSINWYKIAGGGGTSGGTNGSTVYSLSGTIGQHDAGNVMTGGSYALTGGFWSIVGIVSTQGAPTLTITRVSGNIVISWPSSGSFTLQQNANLATPGSWATSGYTVSNDGSTNSITISPPTGQLFFRLIQP
jgi:hypothetical protein